MPTEDELQDSVAAITAKIDAQIEHARALAGESARLSAEAADATASITSPDGRVTVTARPTGRVDAVRLTRIDPGMDAHALGRTITATIAQAQRTAAERVLGSMAQTLGEDSPLVAAVRADIEASFPGGRDESIRWR